MRDFDEFIKTAATYKEVMRPYKAVSPARAKGIINRMREPEGYNGVTKTKIRPFLDTDNEISYSVNTHGPARHADSIDATTNLIDLIDRYHRDKGEDDYNEYSKRMKPYIDKYKGANFITRGHHGRKMIKSMTDDERDELVKYRDKYGDLHTKDPRNAQRATSHTTTVVVY